MHRAGREVLCPPRSPGLQPDPWEHLRRLLNWGPRTYQRHILRLAKMRIWNLDNRG